MRVLDIRQHFLEGLSSYVEEYGFKMLKSGFEIVKKDKEKSLELRFFQTDWLMEIRLEPCLWINFKPVFRILKKAGVFDNPPYGHLVNNCAQMNLIAYKHYLDNHIPLRDMKCIYGISPYDLILIDGRFCPSVEMYRQHEGKSIAEFTPVFRITDEKSYEPVVEYVKDLFQYAIRYFEWLGSLEAINNYYNALPLCMNNPNTIIWPVHIAVGIIAAKLVNKENYEAIKNAYLEFLKHFKSDYDNSLLKLIDYLDSPEFK
ncbi:MAG: hypothetical protein K2L34_07940 [Muribaculaceae bacterium]|nr:hypothetical protein [Muribaculaceae bacterium]